MSTGINSQTSRKKLLSPSLGVPDLDTDDLNLHLPNDVKTNPQDVLL
jgi:hypothetical protein